MSQARELGRRVAEAQDDALREQDSLREARALWLSPHPAPDAAPRLFDWRVWGGLAAAATFAVAAAVLFTIPLSAPSLAFQVGPTERAVAGSGARRGVVGELVVAPRGERLPVHFSDGSLVRLEPEARVRIVDIASNGSRVLLERGTAHADVVHRGDTRWSVQAGPFDVHVTGTQFDVTWDPPSGRFSITLLEGRVAVSGCAMEQVHVVTTGETFRATCRDEKMETSTGAPSLTPARTAPAASSLAIADSLSTARPVAAPTPAPSAIVRVVAAPAPAPTWRELLALHRYAEAFELADVVGLPSICATSDAATLMDLSDAARFAGRVDRAKLVLLEVRRRFERDERASTAAFDLGRIAFDDEAAYVDAARWFDVYVTERPAGPLAREASGRRMEALERSGDHAAAVASAKRYLVDFPAGPHAEIARSIAAP